MQTPDSRLSAPHRLTGLAIWLSLIGGLALVSFGDRVWLAEAGVPAAIKGFAAMALGALAGVRVGMEANLPTPPAQTVALALSFGLAGLVGLFLPLPLALALFTAAFGGLGAWDSLAAFSKRVPATYARARARMTWAICATLIAMLGVVSLNPIGAAG